MCKHQAPPAWSNEATPGSSTSKGASIAWPDWKRLWAPTRSKVALRLRVACPSGSDRFHLDAIDLTRDAERRRFIERAAEETGLTAELLKRDIGKLLLAVEQAQAELNKPQETLAPKVILTAGGTRGSPAMAHGAQSHWPAARSLSRCRHHRGRSQHPGGLPGLRLPQTRTAPGRHHPKRQRRRENHAHGRGALVLPGGRAHQILAP